MDGTAQVTFESMNEGHQIYLSDGSVWRASRDAAAMVRTWQKGDSVEVAEKANADAIWRFVITNQRTGAFASALPSSRMI